MAGARRRFARSEKTSARDVVDYEIRMLEHCATQTIAVTNVDLDENELAILEAFLLHFRILLEFFGKPSTNPRFADNLHFAWPQSHGGTPTPDALKDAKRIAKELEVAWGEKLNKFLAHPTDRRYTTQREWPVEDMRDEMRRLIGLWRALWI